MTTTTPATSRTARLLALMTKGDNAFNARDFAAVDAVHHPDMVAYITGLAEPVYGRRPDPQVARRPAHRHPRVLGRRPATAADRPRLAATGPGRPAADRMPRAGRQDPIRQAATGTGAHPLPGPMRGMRPEGGSA
jgi:hypothetical protein